LGLNKARTKRRTNHVTTTTIASCHQIRIGCFLPIPGLRDEFSGKQGLYKLPRIEGQQIADLLAYAYEADRQS